MNKEPALRIRGKTRLKRILISEAAHLLWTLRCNRVICGQSYTRTAITTKWKHTIDTRLDIDRRLTKANRKQYTKTKVLHTWTRPGKPSSARSPTPPM
ncbi:hypothetical protein J3R82DRAFT_8211 [Butyriboletus roseoflavus]|nr:hypothetical protein J3R82DRAFT_8211 [Butyriboletus roseoflavus]